MYIPGFYISSMILVIIGQSIIEINFSFEVLSKIEGKMTSAYFFSVVF